MTSLNGNPETRMVIEAAGIKNCSHYSEQSTSESNGYFRIRGLIPYCSYKLQIKEALDDSVSFERFAPSSITLAVKMN